MAAWPDVHPFLAALGAVYIAMTGFIGQKSSSFAGITDEQAGKVMNKLNHRPRKR